MDGDAQREEDQKRQQMRRSAIIVPARQPAYGRTPEWVEKSTKDFLENLPTRNHLKSLKYTKPDLRERLKRQIMAGSKGGRPGQWSARKAQLLALAYRKAGGGYRGKPGKSQRSLKKWTKERWTTSDGKPALRRGKMSRYLPAAAWKRLTPAQRRATIAKKLAGDKKGRQFVPNTQRAATASQKIRNRKAALESAISIKALSENGLVEPSTASETSLPSGKLPGGRSQRFRPILFEDGDNYVILPTIDEAGNIISDTDAIDRYMSSNYHLGKYDNPAPATQRLNELQSIGLSMNDEQEYVEVNQDAGKRRLINASAIKPIPPRQTDDTPDASMSGYMSRFGV